MASILLKGTLASFLAGSATILGAVPILLFKSKPKHSLVDFLLSLASGVMIGASVFSLILPSIKEGGIWWTVFGIITGAILIFVTDKILEKVGPSSHHYLQLGDKLKRQKTHRGILVVSALIIHNIPEGLAVGVTFAISGDQNIGIALAIAIGLQNMPEGLAVAIPLIEGEMKKFKVFLLVVLSGMVEPVAAFIGILLVNQFVSIIPVALSMAAGAMIYLVTSELLPETHSHGNKYLASLGLFIGFIMLLFLQFSGIFD